MKFKCACMISMVAFCLWAAPVLSQSQSPSMKETEQLDFAQGLFERGMYAMSAEEYQKFITLYPQSTYVEEASMANAESLFLAQDYVKARESLLKFRSAFPQSERFALAALRLGQIDIIENKYDDALKVLTSVDLEKVVKPQTLQGFRYYLGKAYRVKGDLDTAATYLKKALEHNDTVQYTAYACEEYAQIQIEKGEFKSAIDAYAKAVSITEEGKSKGHYQYKLAETIFLSGDYEAAVAKLTEVVEKYSDIEEAPHALSNLLLAHLNLKQYDQVLAIYQTRSSMIKPQAEGFESHYAASRAMAAVGKYNESAALLEQVLAYSGLKDENKRKAILSKADVLISLKKFNDAQVLLESLEDQAGDAAERLYLKAQIAFGLEQFDQAFDLYSQVSTEYKDSGFAKAAMLGMAHAKRKAGAFKDSAELYLSYYNNQDEQKAKGQALYEAAFMSLKDKDYDAAVSRGEEYLSQYALAADNLDAAHYLLGYAYQMKSEYDKALEYYGKINLNKDKDEFFVSALKNAAAVYITLKEPLKAAGSFERIMMEVEKTTLEPKTFWWVLNEYIKVKRFNDVLRVSEVLAKHYPEDSKIQIAYFRAEAYREMKNYELAINNYQLVLANGSKDIYSSGSYIGMALCLVEQKKLDQAAEHFQKALDENPDDHTVTLRSRFGLGQIALAQKKYDEAIRLFLLIAAIYDDAQYCPESLLLAGGILETLKRNDEALKTYQDILDKYNETPQAVEAQKKMAALNAIKN